ncbi:MAG: polysaccharide deacetylase family protein [Patescibacteria group bacterium]
MKKKKKIREYWKYFLILPPIAVAVLAAVFIFYQSNFKTYLSPFANQLFFQFFQEKGERKLNHLEPAPMVDIVKNRGIYPNRTQTLKIQIALKVPILIYHYIEEQDNTKILAGLYLSPNIFENQLETLKDHGFQPIFARELGEVLENGGVLPKNPIVLTFDDGYADFYYNVFPLLKKYDFKATLFVIVSAIGQSGYVSENQIREMNQSGLVEIGSHTLNHVSLKFIDDEKAKTEIFESKRKLERIISEEVKSFAYPYGFFIDRDEQLVREAGYLDAFSTYAGLYQKKENIFRLYRLRPEEKTGDELIRFVSYLK